jgi:excisionase family DNA binding protein
MSKGAFSVNELVCEIGIGKTKIYEEMRNGRIRARKSGRRTIVPASEVERYLRSLPLRFDPSLRARAEGEPRDE